jgi:hypothetical protein
MYECGKLTLDSIINVCMYVPPQISRFRPDIHLIESKNIMAQQLTDLQFNPGGGGWNFMFEVNSSILNPFTRRTSIFLILAGTTRVDRSSTQYLYFTAEI